jgi:hypothetical protein
MSDSTRGTGAVGPPWSVDVLADLHAGALDARQSAALWAQVNRDPGAQAVLAALDSVRRDLDTLGDAPVEPMPQHFAAQLDAALAAEMARSTPAARPQEAARPGVAPVADMAAARRRRNRRMGWAAGVLTAAAAAVAITFVALPGEQETGGVAEPGDQAGTSQGQSENVPPLALTGNDLGPAISGLTGQKDYGSMDDEQGLRDCLSELGIDKPQVIGAREVTLDGTEGVAALLAGGDDGHRFRLVIVDPQCTKLINNTSLG